MKIGIASTKGDLSGEISEKGGESPLLFNHWG